VFQLASSSTRVITDPRQEKSRIFIWKDDKAISGKDRHLARTVIEQAANAYGLNTDGLIGVRWCPSDKDCDTPHYLNPFLFRSGGRNVDLHVRVR
jgi:hypothetical protein